MKFKKLIVKYLTGDLLTEELPQIGITGLEEGYDSPSLCILAGLERNESYFEMKKYIQQALNELNIPIPDDRKAYITYAFILSEEIINKKGNVIEGVDEMMKKVIRKYDFYAETKNYVYDSIFFENVYDLYNNYDDLLDAQCAGVEWVKGKPNDEELVNAEIDIFNSLKEWNEKVKAHFQLAFWIT